MAGYDHVARFAREWAQICSALLRGIVGPLDRNRDRGLSEALIARVSQDTGAPVAISKDYPGWTVRIGEAEAT